MVFIDLDGLRKVRQLALAASSILSPELKSVFQPVGKITHRLLSDPHLPSTIAVLLFRRTGAGKPRGTQQNCKILIIPAARCCRC